MRLDRGLAALAVLFAALAIAHLIAGRLPFTGDEQRYAAEGVALYSAGSTHISKSDWDRFLSENGLPQTDQYAELIRYNPPSLGPGVIFGPALRLEGLSVARWFSFLIGCLGIIALFLVFRQGLFPIAATDGAILGSTFCVTLSLPFIPYMRLIYPEMPLFAIGAYALFSLARRHSLATVIAAGILPFISIRALPLSLAFLAVVTWDSVKNTRPRLQIARDITCYAALLTIYLLLQHAVWGSFTGAAHATHKLALSEIPTRIAMALYDVRHGLITYAPLYLLGLCGLLAGTLQRNRVCKYSLILLISYVATFMWSNASESFAGRFWVAAIPFLAVGIAYWLGRASTWAQWLPAVPCLAISLVNTVLFCYQPLWFLENRRASISYSALFKWTHVHLGLLLPVDNDVGGLPAYTDPVAVLLLFTTVLLVLFTVLLVGTRSRLLACIMTLLVLSMPIVAGAGRALPKSAYSVSTDMSSSTVTIVSKDGAQNLRAVQLDGQLSRAWDPRNFPRYLSVRCFHSDGSAGGSRQPSRPLVSLPDCRGVTKVVIGVFRVDHSSVLTDLGPLTIIQAIGR